VHTLEGGAQPVQELDLSICHSSIKIDSTKKLAWDNSETGIMPKAEDCTLSKDCTYFCVYAMLQTSLGEKTSSIEAQ